MTCDEYRQHLSAFVDGELADAGIRQLFQHLGTCGECWKYYRRIEHLRNVLTAESAPAELQAESSQLKPPAAPSTTERLDRPPERQWMKQRVAVSPSSFLLGNFVAFVVGVLLALTLSSGSSATGPGIDNRWAGEPLQRPGYSPIHNTTSHVAPTTRQQ
jgi:anti-sigma factor RsiW